MSYAITPGDGGDAQTSVPGSSRFLTIPPRFNGPPASGNGGYACGRVAACFDGPATVTLRRPPPLATPMSLQREAAASVRVHRGQTLIAEAVPASGSPVTQLPNSVSWAEAQAVAGSARYYRDPLFPDCFVCGTGRQPGDGLRIFPGPLAGRPLWAAPWTPDLSVTDADDRVRPEMVWAALDCPSGIAAAEAANLTGDTAILLGRMTASVTARPAANDQCLVVAWPRETDGRKLLASSALIGPDGQLLAAASTVWLTVPRPVPALAAEGVSS